MLSVEQVRNTLGSDSYQISLAPVSTAGTWFDLPDGDILYRFWRPHARYALMPTSPLRNLLDAWEERNRIDDGYKAVEQSRIAQAGILLLDARARFPDQGDANQGDSDPATNDTLSKIAEAGMTAIQQPDSAAAALPVMLELDMGDSLDRRIQDYAYHLTLDRNMTDADAARWTVLTTQIIQGLPCPPEIITGLGASSTYANARLVTQEAYSAYVDPVVRIICDTFTRAWVRPALIDAGVPVEVADKVVVWADPDTIISQPDRAKYALDLYNAGQLSGQSLRAATGFDEGDAPADDVAQESKIAAVGVPSLLQAQVMTINEARAASGLPPVADGDRFLTAEEIASQKGAQQQTRGQLPPSGDPTAGEDNPNGDDTLPASAFLPVVASANPAEVAVLGERLAAIDAGLNAWLSEACSQALEQALGKAGQRLRAKAQGTGAAKHLRGVPNTHVFASLGAERVVVLAATDTLLESAFSDLEPRFDSEVRKAQQRALSVASAVDPEAYDGETSTIEQEQDDARAASWAWLLAALVSLAEQRLPDPDSQGDTRGEVNTNTAVPFGFVRGATMIAGGADPDTLGDPNYDVVPTDQVPGGVGTGDTIRASLETLAAVVPIEYVWVWGGADKPFPPHEALDGTVFQSPDDPELANYESFPDTSHFYAGDHAGCSCQAVPQFVTMDSESDPEGLG